MCIYAGFTAGTLANCWPTSVTLALSYSVAAVWIMLWQSGGSVMGVINHCKFSVIKGIFSEKLGLRFFKEAGMFTACICHSLVDIMYGIEILYFS